MKRLYRICRRPSGALLALDPGPLVLEIPAARLAGVLRRVGLLTMNQREARLLAGSATDGADAATGADSATDVAATTAAAHRADSIYDQAAAIIQAQRRAAGLGPAIDLPDPA